MIKPIVVTLDTQPRPPKVRDEEALIQDFLGRARLAFTNRQAWFQGQIKAKSIRRGILNELDWPYKGASNPNVPVTDAIIRNKKAAFLSVLALEPPVLFEVRDERATQNLSQRLEQWMAETYDRMRVRRRYERLVDGYLERSGFFVKVGYDRQADYVETTVDLDRMSELDVALFNALQDISLSEAFAAAFKMDEADPGDAAEIAKAVKQYEAGERKIRFRRRVTVKDLPEWLIMEGQDLIRDPKGPADLQKHSLLIHRFHQTVREIRAKVKAKIYDAAALEQVAGAKLSQAFDGDTEQAQLEAQEVAADLPNRPVAYDHDNLHDHEDVEIETYEVYTWWSPDPERVPAQRAAFTFFPVYHQGRLIRRRWLTTSYWPFREFDYDNPSDETYGGRGIPLMMESEASEINMLHKGLLDAIPWMTTMAGTYDKNKLLTMNGAAFGLNPGEFMPANGPGALEPVRAPSAGVELINEARELQGHAEALFGSIQPVLGRRGAGGSQGDPTATEINTLSAREGSLLDMEISSFQDAMNDVHEMTFDAMVENMPETVRFPYRDATGAIQFDEIQRQELIGLRPRIRSHGNLTNSSAGLTARRLRGWLPLAQVALAFGIQANVGDILRKIVAAEGERNPEKLFPVSQQAPQGAGGPGVPGAVPMAGQPQGAMGPQGGGGGASPDAGRQQALQAAFQTLSAGGAV